MRKGSSSIIGVQSLGPTDQIIDSHILKSVDRMSSAAAPQPSKEATAAAKREILLLKRTSEYEHRHSVPPLCYVFAETVKTFVSRLRFYSNGWTEQEPRSSALY